MQQSRTQQSLSLIAHSGFALTGVVATLLGVILPTLTVKWSLSDTYSGYLLAAQATGGLLSNLVVGRVINRFGIDRALPFAFMAMAVGIASISAGVWWVMLAAVFACGTGLGFSIPAITILIAEMNRQRRAAALNILNFVWCIGAILGPLVIALLLRKANLFLPLFGLAIILLLLAVLLFSKRYGHFRQIQQPEDQEPKQQQQDDRSPSAFVIFICAIVFLCVGVENALSGWIVSYGLRLSAPENPFGSLLQSAFWAAMLCGRAVAPVILRYLVDAKLVLFGIGLATIGILVILAASELFFLTTGVFITGVGLSSVFPTTIAIFSEHQDTRAAGKTGWLFVMGSIGSSIVPWLVGFLSSQFAELRSGLTILLVAALLMLAFQTLITLRYRLT